MSYFLDLTYSTRIHPIMSAESYLQNLNASVSGTVDKDTEAFLCWAKDNVRACPSVSLGMPEPAANEHVTLRSFVHSFTHSLRTFRCHAPLAVTTITPLPPPPPPCFSGPLLLSRHSKCRVIIYRYAGCDHMSCRCSRSFNWSQADRVGGGMTRPPISFDDLPTGLYHREVSGTNGLTLQGIGNSPETQLPEGAGLSSLGLNASQRTGGSRGFQLPSIFSGLF